MRETADKNNPFTCPMCGITFSSQAVLDRHKQDDHNEPTALQDIIGKLATVILFLKARYATSDHPDGELRGQRR
jgi:hypothetical protein